MARVESFAKRLNGRVMEIRHPTIEDAEHLRSLYLELLGSTFASILPPEAIIAFESDWTTKLIAQSSVGENCVVIGAFNDANNALGLLFGGPPEGGVGTIVWLGVHTDHRSSGIGRALMEVGFETYRALGCHKVKLYANSDKIVEFYKHMNMVIEGRHTRHWWGVNTHSLAKFLD
jgi:ribosomal protein S18 acetylase RimI-like enzyme